MTLKSNILEKLNNEIYLVAGDASPRKFYRFKNKKKQILVYCKKDKKNNLENINGKRKISTKKIFTLVSPS